MAFCTLLLYNFVDYSFTNCSIMLTWKDALIGFTDFLQVQKNLSKNSIDAYISDVSKLELFAIKLKVNSPVLVSKSILIEFIATLQNLSARTQARVQSGIKAFYQYLLLEDIIEVDPSETLDTPRTSNKLPEVLTVDEIDSIIDAIDVSKLEGHRNRAMIEVLYSCGIRVSELTDLKLTDLFLSEGYIRVLGKGNKQRLVPISGKAMRELNFYLNGYRSSLEIDLAYRNTLFLNRFGKSISRVAVFTMIKDAAKLAGINKNISPHTFRHTFASHLVDGGADLRAVQEMLGHISILTTEIYSHLNNTYLQDTVHSFHPRNKVVSK